MDWLGTNEPYSRRQKLHSVWKDGRAIPFYTALLSLFYLAFGIYMANTRPETKRDDNNDQLQRYAFSSSHIKVLIRVPHSLHSKIPSLKRVLLSRFLLESIRLLAGLVLLGFSAANAVHHRDGNAEWLTFIVYVRSLPFSISSIHLFNRYTPRLSHHLCLHLLPYPRNTPSPPTSLSCISWP
jgi:hypothetical protein